MHLVILEPLAVPAGLISSLFAPFTEKGWTLTAYDSRPKDQAELGERLRGADAAVIANFPCKKEALEKADALRYLCVAFTGVDHVDIAYCREKGIPVSNCAGYSTEAVAELALGMALALVRDFPACGNAVRNGGTNAGLMGAELSGKTFGIIGTGAIGSRTAALARAFGCETIGWSRTPKDPAIRYESLETVLAESDIVSVHLPLNDATRGLIGEKEIALMKPTAYLLNTARGPVVDSAALASALHAGKLAGAGIDVYETEPPLPAAHPLLSAPHCLMTPHVGFFSAEAMKKRAAIVFENIEAWEAGAQKNVICGK